MPSAGTVLQYPPEVHGPTTTIGRAREIVCKEDWTSAPETQKSADTLALSLNPYPRSAGADAALREAGVLTEEQTSPFAVLAKLKGGAPDA